jgi:signal transduction histidine kinase
MHIGLDTLAERVRLGGGRLTLESESGCGTCVTVELPAC